MKTNSPRSDQNSCDPRQSGRTPRPKAMFVLGFIEALCLMVVLFSFIGALYLIVVAGTAVLQRAKTPISDQGSVKAIEVNLASCVTDKENHPVNGLTSLDYKIYEDGVEQPITALRADDGQVWISLRVVATAAGSGGEKLTVKTRSGYYAHEGVTR